MALAPDVATSTDPNPIEDEGTHVNAPGLQYFVFGLFFIFGGITSLNDVIIPKLKELFTLSWTEAMLVQFCFFAAYAIIGIPGAKLVKKIGYMRGAVAGLLTMMTGCLLFIPASQTATYAIFLFRAVHPRQRRGDRAGGGQPADQPARPGQHHAQAA